MEEEVEITQVKPPNVYTLSDDEETKNDAKIKIDLTQENKEPLDLNASSRKTTPGHDRH